MKKAIAILSILLMCVTTTMTAENGVYDPYDPSVATYDPFDPTAPVSGTDSGLNIAAIGVGIVAIAAATAIIVASSNGSSTDHTHS